MHLCAEDIHCAPQNIVSQCMHVSIWAVIGIDICMYASLNTYLAK